MSRLYVFDMDGTLLPGTTACLEIAKHTGTTAELCEIESLFTSGVFSTAEFARAIHELWGVLDEELVRRSFDLAPKLENIQRVLDEVAKQRSLSCLITMSPGYFARQFGNYGFDYIFGSEFPDGVDVPFDPTRILTPEDKPRIAAEICQRENLDFSRTVAFGDSSTDIPMFDRVRWSVAVNAADSVLSSASLVYQGGCLWSAFQLVQRGTEKSDY